MSRRIVVSAHSVETFAILLGNFFSILTFTRGERYEHQKNSRSPLVPDGFILLLAYSQ